MLIPERDTVARKLREEHGIDTRIAYPMPVYAQELYSSGQYECRWKPCPVAEDFTSRVLNLPIHASLDEKTIEYIADRLFRILDKLRIKLKLNS